MRDTSIRINVKSCSFEDSSWDFEPGLEIALWIENKKVNSFLIPIIEMSIDDRIDWLQRKITKFEDYCNLTGYPIPVVRAEPKWCKHLTTCTALLNFYASEKSDNDAWSEVKRKVQGNLNYEVRSTKNGLGLFSNVGVYKNMCIAHRPNLALNILTKSS